MIEPRSQDGSLPSARALIRSTAIAAAVASALLVTIVLPAEYGVDPTGFGRLVGLTEMGEIKTSLEEEARTAAGRPSAPTAPCPPAAPLAAAPAPAAQPPAAAADTAAKLQNDVTKVTLKPGEGKEVKLTMREGAQATYSWSTDRGGVNYDTHGDPTDPAKGTYHGYGKGTAARSHEGVLVAAFDGMHGWFWRNRTKQVVTITLLTSGDYQGLKELD